MRRATRSVQFGALALLLGLLLAGCGAPSFVGGVPGLNKPPRKTLDRDGGLRLTLTCAPAPAPDPTPTATPTGTPGADATPVATTTPTATPTATAAPKQSCDLTKVTNAVSDVLAVRALAWTGFAGAAATRSGDTTLLLELPGVTDADAAAALMTQRGKLTFVDTGGEALHVGGKPTKAYPVLFTGEQLDKNSIQAGIDAQSGRPIVAFAFSGDAKERFAKYTGDHIGQFLTILADGTVIESATIQSQIVGNGQVAGLDSLDAARRLAAILVSGPLPIDLRVVTTERVKPGS